MDEKTHRRCTQTNCKFYREGGCKSCEKCNAEPFVLKKSCSKCLACENVPNSLRFSDENSEKEMISQVEQEELMAQHVAAIIEAIYQYNKKKEDEIVERSRYK